MWSGLSLVGQLHAADVPHSVWWRQHEHGFVSRAETIGTQWHGNIICKMQMIENANPAILERHDTEATPSLR